MRRALVALIVLAGCGREVPVPPAPSFREAGTLIGSTTRGGPGDMAGEWIVDEAFPGAPYAGPGTRVTISPGTDMNTLWTFEAGGQSVEVAAVQTAPGRYVGATAAFWVVWTDDDFRTAVIGTPDGSFGWIMDRPGEASPDRTRAAREMLDFSGYDTARLVP